ncbi:hypothetical protein PV328_011991, partial [Microctonus aethiopoides]
MLFIYLNNCFITAQLRREQCIENEEIIEVNFKPTNQKLANKFLPIWIINEDEPDVLHRETNLMSELGDFVMYQCPKTSSAAVGFDKHNQFVINSFFNMIKGVPKFTQDFRSCQRVNSCSGIIDSRFIIDNQIFVRKSSRFFENENQKNSDLLESLLMRIKDEKIKLPKSHQIMTKTAYVETLVLVNYDLVKE